ncbi:hypothetical protein BJV78DRAFT_1272164 [Lactifluus subvellereus]|nr:hypothetical protein BJV78DRAFT_1272164 [Lactifluus subvellereus]
MPTTRSQAALEPKDNRPLSGRTYGKKAWQYRSGGDTDSNDTEKPPGKTKKRRGRLSAPIRNNQRGHIYLFYRPKVEQEEAYSIDQVAYFHILLVPRPPQFATYAGDGDQQANMKVLSEGADAIPVQATRDTPKKHHHFRAGGGRKETSWATVTAVGDDLTSLEKGLGEKDMRRRPEMKSANATSTAGTRHEAPSRVVGPDAYAIVNNEPRVPSGRSTHLGYCLSHPTEPGEPQKALGLHLSSSSFIVQFKNPLTPASEGQRLGLSPNKRAKYSDWIIDNTFGRRGSKGREEYGLRFVSVETIELLKYKGAEPLLIVARAGEEVLRELATDSAHFPAEPLHGDWI